MACRFLVPFNVFTLVSGRSLLIPLTNINCRHRNRPGKQIVRILSLKKKSVSTNKEHFQPGVLAAVLFPTKKGKSVTVCVGQILDIDDQEFQCSFMNAG
jgi:hypothetical protein